MDLAGEVIVSISGNEFGDRDIRLASGRVLRIGPTGWEADGTSLELLSAEERRREAARKQGEREERRVRWLCSPVTQKAAGPLGQAFAYEVAGALADYQRDMSRQTFSSEIGAAIPGQKARNRITSAWLDLKYG